MRYLLLALLFISSAHSSDFNPDGRMSCSTAWGEYNEIQKMVISKEKENGKRDLFYNGRTWRGGNTGTVKDACMGQGIFLECEFNGYELVVNFSTLTRDHNDDGELTNYSLEGTVEKKWSLRKKATIRCRQDQRDMLKYL